MHSEQVTRYFCDICSDCYINEYDANIHEAQHAAAKEIFNMKIFKRDWFEGFNQVSGIDEVNWYTYIPYAYFETKEACDAFKQAYIAAKSFQQNISNKNFPTEPGWYALDCMTGTSFGTPLTDESLIAELTRAAEEYVPTVDDVYAYLVENNILSYPKTKPEDWERYLCVKEDRSGKYIRLLACCYYTEINYTYGEDVDQGPPKPELQEWVEKYPDYFDIEECYECCGCGDW